MSPDKLVKRIGELIFEKKGEDVKVIELSTVTTMTDYFVICTASSDTQVRAIADHVEKELRDEGVKVWHKEGYKAVTWILLDYIHVVVHIFLNEHRAFYNLEKLWGDAPQKQLVDKPKKPRAKAKAKIKE